MPVVIALRQRRPLVLVQVMVVLPNYRISGIPHHSLHEERRPEKAREGSSPQAVAVHSLSPVNTASITSPKLAQIFSLDSFSLAIQMPETSLPYHFEVEFNHRLVTFLDAKACYSSLTPLILFLRSYHHNVA